MEKIILCRLRNIFFEFPKSALSIKSVWKHYFCLLWVCIGHGNGIKWTYFELEKTFSTANNLSSEFPASRKLFWKTLFPSFWVWIGPRNSKILTLFLSWKKILFRLRKIFFPEFHASRILFWKILFLASWVLPGCLRNCKILN